MSSSIDEDVGNTLNKLYILLQYSSSVKSDSVYQLIAKAKAIWEDDSELEDNWTSKKE